MVHQHLLTERVEAALQDTQQVARGFHHDQIVTEHLLLAVLAEVSGEVGSLLAAQGVDSDSIRSAVTRMTRPGRSSDATDEILPHTPRVREVFGYAAQETAALGREDIDIDALLLALRVEGKGIAALAMADAGVSGNRLRQEIVRRQRRRPA